MAQTLYLLFKEIRPRQWLKNLTLFAAIFFTGQFLNPSLFVVSSLGFIIFCLASSSLYVFNDWRDLVADRLHPFKKNRPLASGKLPLRLAALTAAVFAVLAVFLAGRISANFLIILLVFAGLQIAYSLFLKNIILVDILAIAGSFILRVFAGEVATGFHIDIWLFLTVISGSLFVAIGKRRSELTLLSGWQGALTARTRSTLSRYSEKMLDVYLSMFANSAWITYAFYTFLREPPVLHPRLVGLIDPEQLMFFSERKWLMLTTPLVIYGIMRYLQLIYEKNQGESPEKVLLADGPLILTALALFGVLFAVIYLIGR